MNIKEYRRYLRTIYFLDTNNLLIFFYNKNGIEKYLDEIDDLINCQHLIEIVNYCVMTGNKMFVFPKKELDYDARQDAIVVLNQLVKSMHDNILIPSEIVLKLEEFILTTFEIYEEESTERYE